MSVFMDEDNIWGQLFHSEKLMMMILTTLWNINCGKRDDNLFTCCLLVIVVLPYVFVKREGGASR